jgi:phosphatidylglycerol:prolipoprotein diacylglycerol transferase
MGIDFPLIDPVALAIGPLQIRWYALAYMVGFLAGWKYCLYLAGRFAGYAGVPTRDNIDDFLPWAIAGVILGGRLGYVLFYQSGYYIDNPAQILKIWQGGMSFHGGLSGVIIAMILYARLKDLRFWRLADILACATPIGLFFGRIANFVNGELYGRIALDVPWAVRFPTPDGANLPRHPSQLYEAALEGAVLFVILLMLAHRKALRKYSGLWAGVFLMGYGLSRFVIEYVREPDAHLGLIGGGVLSMGQILSVPMIVAGGVIVFFAVKYAAGDNMDSTGQCDAQDS